MNPLLLAFGKPLLSLFAGSAIVYSVPARHAHEAGVEHRRIEIEQFEIQEDRDGLLKEVKREVGPVPDAPRDRARPAEDAPDGEADEK